VPEMLGYGFFAQNGEFVPDMAIAGGFTFEDQIYKGLALGAPYFNHRNGESTTCCRYGR